MSTTNGHSSALPSVDWARPHDDALTQLERQVVRGNHFAQAALDKLQARLARAEATINALHELLESAGLIVAVAPEQAEDVADENPASDTAVDSGADTSADTDLDTAADAAAEPAADVDAEPEDEETAVNWPGIAFGTEPAEPEQPAPVDCAARMHICHAVCCKLSFALTPPEVEAGATKWDLGFPYMIRHESNGYCTHNDTSTGRCGIYADRPGVCRRYSCANDARIWKDFEAMELNEEWIRESLQNRSRIMVRPALPIMEINGTPSRGGI